MAAQIAQASLRLGELSLLRIGRTYRNYIGQGGPAFPHFL
jgi:hypothetical protein